MAKDDFTRLQNYIKRLASSAEEARELISQLVLIDWNAIYPAKQNTVVTTPIETKLLTIADTAPIKNEILVRAMQAWDETPIITTTDLTHQVVGPTQVTDSPMKKPRRAKRMIPGQPKEPKPPKPSYWEAKQMRLEKIEARLAKSPRVKELQAMPYAEYLKTDEWQKTRRRALANSGVKCQMCSATDKPLNVHHNTYERLGYERASDLITLCEPCHAKHHDKLPKALQ